MARVQRFPVEHESRCYRGVPQSQVGDTMTTYPSASDPVSALTRADGTTEAHSTDHGRVIGIWENVKHHGAKADGTTDDAAAFTAAIAAISSTRGGVYVPPGNYKLASAVAIPDWVKVKGFGRNQTNINFTN